MMPFDIASFTLAHGDPNEDALLYRFNEEVCLLGIADGVGSADGSHEASRLAVSKCLETLSQLGAPGIGQAFESARLALISRAKELEYKSMSTTLTVCVATSNVAYFGHVGDARLYHLRGNGLATRTADQTEVEHLIAEGVISRERAKRYPRKNILLSALSTTSQFDLQSGHFQVEVGDRIVLLTDGVHRLLSKRSVLEQSHASDTVDIFAKRLQQCVEQKGLIDDATCICVEVIT